VSGQQHGLVVLDAQDQVVRPAKLWCDTSTASQCDQIAHEFGGQAGCIHLAGNAILPGYTIPKLLWLKQNEPDNFAKVTSILLPHDYINFHLSGVKRMEYGDASGMGPEDEDSMNDNNMECEHCGATGCPEGANYCHMCGEHFPSFANAAKECSECGAATMEGANRCHMCGAVLPESVTNNALGCGNCGETTPVDAMYCPTCGDPVPQAESTDEASNLNEEEVNVEINATDAVTSAEETATAGLTLSTADLQAIAKMVIAGLKPAESTEPAADAEAEIDEPAEVKAEEPAEEIADEEPAAEVEATESNSQEIDVTDNMFTAEQVQAIVAEAAAKAATAAVEAARTAAVEDYRAGRGIRKGLTASSITNDASDLSEAEFTPEMLAEMNSSQFRKAQAEVWSGSPFFQAKFAQADRGF
jgi:hypothetical protein